MIDNPLTPLNMSSSPSISNYSEIGQYRNSSPYVKSAGERNSKAIRRRFRRPAVEKPQPWNVRQCVIQLRDVEGLVREVSGYEVSRGEVVKRFVSFEGMSRFISQN